MTQDQSPLDANFSTLVLSLASQAALFLGLAPDPTTGSTQVDVKLARFNIDLLLMLDQKTQNNLNAEESQFLSRMIKDLQMHYVQAKERGYMWLS